MSRIIIIVKKLLIGLALMVGTAMAATITYGYYYQEQIIQVFLEKTNKKLRNPLQIGGIQLTFLRSFPQIGLVLKDVVVKSQTPSAPALITARKAYFAFDLWKMLQGQYVVSHLSLAHGKLYLGRDLAHQLGGGAEERVTAPQDALLTIRRHNIVLKDMEVMYSSEQGRYDFHAANIEARLKGAPTGLDVSLQGQATIRRIQIQGTNFVQNLPLSLQAALSYEQQGKTWVLGPTYLQYGSSQLAVQGGWDWEGKYSPAFTIQGKKIDPHLLLRCLPSSYYQKIKPYDLRGQLSLSLNANKKNNRPFSLQGDLMLENGTLALGRFAQPIVLDKLLGSLHIPNVWEPATALLEVKEVASSLAQSKLTGSFTIRNFQSPHLQCAAKATVDVMSLSPLITDMTITDASGKVDIAWDLAANLHALIQGRPPQNNLQLSGRMQGQAIQLKLGRSQLLCKELGGSLTFQDNAWVIQDITGSIGPGSLQLNGTIHNLLPYLLSDKQQCYADAKLYMDYLDIDALRVNGSQLRPKDSTTPAFYIAPRWGLNLACDIQQLHFRRFKSHNVRGQLKIKNQKLAIEQLKLGVAGGKACLDGTLDAGTKELKINTAAKLRGVQLAPLFYMFENFHQKFLVDKHLSGEVFSDFDLTMQTDKQGHIYWDTLCAEMDVQLNKGILQDFEPMLHLAKYVEKDSLKKLRFSELKNHIRIRDQTIYLSPMEVHSNVTRIHVSGTHTFGGKIDYKLVVPFAGFQRQEGKEAPEEVGHDVLQGINLFLRLKGNINNYKITNDPEALQKSFKGNLQQQRRVLKELWQGQPQTKARPQELADDYFEFD